MWVGPKLIIPDKEYDSLGMGVGTLELVLATETWLAAQSPRAFLLQGTPVYRGVYYSRVKL